jgi:hypothetical protein
LPLESKKDCSYYKQYDDQNSISKNLTSYEIPKSEAENFIHVVLCEFTNVKNQKL